MATRIWTGNAGAVTQVDTMAVSAVANAATLTVTINSKTVVYTCTNTDTTTTAAAGLQALLASCTYPEFLEITWTTSTTTVIATAATSGTPFTATCVGAGGATITNTHTTANQSPSDANNANNYSGNTLPVNGDTLIFSNSSVPVLWNLSSISGVTLAVCQVWSTYTGQIGLPENNPAGYIEYRPTYFAIGITAFTVGYGGGQGCGLMRFNVGSVQCALTVLATGSVSAGTAFALRFLGTHASNTVIISGGTVGIAMLASEVATIATLTVQQTGSVALGSGCTLTTLTNNGAAMTLYAGATTLTCTGGSLFVGGSGAYTTLTGQIGAQITYTSSGTITTLSLSQGSTFDVSSNPSGRTITNSTVTGDCTVNDPNNTITWTNATAVTGAVTTGTFVFGVGRTVKIT